MGGPLGWEVALVPAAILLFVAVAFIAAWLGAGRTGPWTATQERAWEALHTLDDVVRERGESSERANMRGRLGGASVSVRLSQSMIVVASAAAPPSPTISRAVGTQIDIEIDLPHLDGALVARTVAPRDDDGDSWAFPERTCEALGEPFRSESEPPAWLVARLDRTGVEALSRLAKSFDPQARRGWLRVGVEVTRGRARIGGVAFDAPLEEMLALALAIAGPPPIVATSSDPYRAPIRSVTTMPAPPMPAREGRRGFARARDAMRAFGADSPLFALALGAIFLGTGALLLAALARPLDATVVEVSVDEGETIVTDLDGMSLSVTGTGADRACPRGSRVRKRAWSGALECERGTVETGLAGKASGGIGIGLVAMFGLALHGYRNRRREARPPARLPDAPTIRSALKSSARRPRKTT